MIQSSTALAVRGSVLEWRQPFAQCLQGITDYVRAVVGQNNVKITSKDSGLVRFGKPTGRPWDSSLASNTRQDPSPTPQRPNPTWRQEPTLSSSVNPGALILPTGVLQPWTQTALLAQMVAPWPRMDGDSISKLLSS